MSAVTSSSKMNGKSASPEGATGASASVHQLPQALQNLQRILQSQLANVNPLQLQQALQRQQHQQMVDAGRKQLEQMLQQLQEQLQINILQQTHLNSTGSGSSNGKQSLHGLQQQQHQLMAQIQLTQQALMLGQNMDGQSDSSLLLKEVVGGRHRERHLSETLGSVGSSDGSLKENRPDNNNGIFKGLNGRAPPTTRVGLLSPKSPPRSPQLNQTSPASQDNVSSVEKLFSHGHCHWPGCEVSLPDSAAFFRHLSTNHILDDKATAQTRVQMQIVDQLELQLAKEKGRLQGMMKHLHLETTKTGELKPMDVSPGSQQQEQKQQQQPSHLHLLQSSLERGELGKIGDQRSKRSSGHGSGEVSSRMAAAAAAAAAMFPNLPTSIAASLGLPPNTSLQGLASLPNLPNLPASLSSPLSALNAAVQRGITSTTNSVSCDRPATLYTQASGISLSNTPIRPKPPPSSISSAAVSGDSKLTPGGPGQLSLPPGFDERRGRGDRGNPNLDPEMDIQQNREFYMHNDVRPPYTYAALIRYAIHETHDEQLTLHEIYNWFTHTFAYFRRNAASWKNAVRHNLSLHKCFMRVENVKGAVWTVDDEEYYRRRPPRGVGASPSPGSGGSLQSPTLTPQTPSIIDQNLSSMFSAAAAAAAAAGGGGAGRMPLPFFGAGSPLTLPNSSNRSVAGKPSGLESPPASLDNRSTPGSLDLSRCKPESPAGEDQDDEEEDNIDNIEPEDSNGFPPTMVRVESKAPHVERMEEKADEGEESAEEESQHSDVQNLLKRGPLDPEDLSFSSTKRMRRASSNKSDGSAKQVEPQYSESQGEPDKAVSDCADASAEPVDSGVE